MMLYSEFTSMETTIGSAIESNSGSIGFSRIKRWFTFGSSLLCKEKAARPESRSCGEKEHLEML